jgi:hypothetical protein
VLYEMLTGKRAALEQSGPYPGAPEKLAHVIERCLAPDPDGRWQSARDLQAELKWAAQAPAVDAAVGKGSTRPCGSCRLGHRRGWSSSRVENSILA